MLNSCTLELRAMNDGESKETRTGKAIGSVFAVCDRRKKTDDGWETAGEIKVGVVGWEKLADAVSGIKKGDKFLASGRIESREYNEKTYIDFTVNSIGMLAGAKPKPAEVPADDDLPF